MVTWYVTGADVTGSGSAQVRSDGPGTQVWRVRDWASLTSQTTRQRVFGISCPCCKAVSVVVVQCTLHAVGSRHFTRSFLSLRSVVTDAM